MLDLTILFSSSLIAATIFPAQSELILAALLVAGNHNHLLLLLIATLGNVLGSLINWFLGAYFMKFQDRKWFPIKSCKIEKYTEIYRKRGAWLLLFAWIPIIGDPITLIAGMSRVNIWLFLLLVAIGKAGRYFVIDVFL
jgi:membrane protein YqaA with SNARE-associated domain